MTRRRETIWLAALLGVWSALNLATLARSPTVWYDEVMFTDPAVHWVQGRGLTSTAWPQPPRTAAVLNGPLHTVLLAGWLAAWTGLGAEVGATLVRSLNLVLAAVAAVWLWGLARHTGGVSSARLRLGAAAVFLCASSVSASYRSGRYDMTGLLLVLALVTAVGRRRAGAWSAACLTALLAALVPFAGLYLIPYCLLLAAGAVLLGGLEWLRRVLPALGGLLLGGAALLGMHAYLGTLPFFIGFTRAQSGTPIATKLAAVPANAVRDPSVVLLLAFLAVSLAVELSRRGARSVVAHAAAGTTPGAVAARGAWRARVPLAVVGLLAGALVPLCMTLTGKYPRYYGWMAFVPVLAVVLRIFERAGGGADRGAGRGARAAQAGVRNLDKAPAVPGQGWLVRLGVAALAGALAVGLPLRTVLCLLEWQERDYAKVETFVQAQVRADDRVLAGHSAYYAVIRRAREVYFSDVLSYLSRADLAAITCVIDLPESARWMMAEIGGEWRAVAEYAADPSAGQMRVGRAQLYRLTVYRRVTPAG